MLKQTILVDSPLGIHLRPATAMCDQAIKYKSKISFNYGDGKTANAKSVISILASSVKCGQEIVLEAKVPTIQFTSYPLVLLVSTRNRK